MSTAARSPGLQLLSQDTSSTRGAPYFSMDVQEN
ncbi:hypothetical protein B566_EDAN004514 [Ephemera danica]|nr:hypothetical protein B566_EDAN004514 [Ephemera danica]